METTINNIDLTPEEAKMIEISRERKALEEKENLVRKEMGRANAITETRKKIEAFKKKWTDQNAKAKEYFDAINVIEKDAYSLIEAPNKKGFECSESTDKKDKDGNRIYDVYFSHEEPYTISSIINLKSGVVIQIEEHTVYDGWRSSSKGFEMKIEIDYKTKWYKKAESIHKTITEISAKKELVKRNAEVKSDLKSKALADAKKLFTNFTKIELATDGYSTGYGSKNTWNSMDVIKCENDNGSATLTFYSGQNGIEFNIRNVQIKSQKQKVEFLQSI